MLQKRKTRLLSSAAVALTCVSLAGAQIPEPPQQHTPWLVKAATGVPAYVPQLVAELFNAGVADPRGGEYRELDARFPSPTGRLTIHGWYFPQGFAIGWDGLVHRVLRVGGKLDLEADVLDPRNDFNPQGAARPGIRLTTGQSVDPVVIALLLRLGEFELVARVWSLAPNLAMPPFAQRSPASDWFAAAGKSWLSAAFHDAIEAHYAGDDQLTVDLAGLILRSRALFESALRDMSPDASKTAPSPVAFLEPAGGLMADSERRLKEPPRPPFDPVALRRMDQRTRIAELILRLEDVNERQFSEPGSVPLLFSPICEMLVEEGAAAVEPLIAVLDHDQRLTRSFSAFRSWVPPRTPISVSRAAEAILLKYYGLNSFRWEDPALRNAWLIANKHTSQPERFFNLLAEDAGGESAWLDAAEALADRPYEELRAQTNPSVSELLAKRIFQMKTTSADRVALFLYRWDPTAALPALQHVTRASYPGDLFGRIISARAEAGDGTAIPQWVDILKGLTAPAAEFLTPMWTAVNDPEVQAVATRLFVGSNAAMDPARLIIAGRDGNLLRSPLLIQPVFREAVSSALSRKEVIGSIERHADGSVNLKVPALQMNCISGSCGMGFRGQLPMGTRDIRVCDYVAWSLSRIDGFPAFDLEATAEEKDKAAKLMADFLRSRAADLRAPPIAPASYGDLMVSLARR